MAYLHGIRVTENPTSIAAPVTFEGGLPVVFGTAPVNLADDPDSATNTLFLCSTFAEAEAALGYSSDYDSYTLCQAMDAFFKAFAVGPVVFCNVLDPSTHVADYSETLAVSDGSATSETLGVIKSTVTITDLTEDEDYTLDYDDDGYLVVTMLTDSVTELTLSGSVLDPSAVTYTDIIGAYDSDTGTETGLELVRSVFPKFEQFPGLLLAPGWSHIPAVGVALAAKCEDINEMFRCECVVDIDSSSDGGAVTYDAVESVKEESGFASEHMICVWPKVRYDDKDMYYSAMYAAHTCYVDYLNDNVPYISPSNQDLNITATVLADGTEVVVDKERGNVVNAGGVVTAINLLGFKSWGNNTAAYPDNTDPKDRWICCRRFFSWWGNNFIVEYMDKVDNPANYRLIESIVDSENVRGNALKSEGKCAGIRMEYNVEDNPIEDVLDGHIVFKQYLAPWTPAEDILNELEFDPTMIETALGGGE